MNTNEVVMVGNLTGDPDEVSLSTGKAANFRIALNKRWKDKETGEDRERSDYVDVEVYGKQAEYCLASLTKGDRCIIKGELRFDEWKDENGNPRSKHKVKADVVGLSLEFEARG